MTILGGGVDDSARPAPAGGSRGRVHRVFIPPRRPPPPPAAPGRPGGGSLTGVPPRPAGRPATPDRPADRDGTPRGAADSGTMNRGGSRDRVAILMHTSGAWTRDLLAGVAEYASGRGGWDFRLEPAGYHEDPLPPPGWAGEGVICRVRSDRLRAAVEALGVPAVNVSWVGGHSGRIPQVVSDGPACGRTAAAFFADRLVRHAGYVGPPPGLNYPDPVGPAFAEAMAAAGARVDRFPHPADSATLSLGPGRAACGDWLRDLPKPVALLVWTTTVGHEIVGLCLDAGLGVPDDVAVLAVEGDPVVSALSPVPIAHLDQPPRPVGRRAAAVLDEMMRGGPPPPDPVTVPPRGVVERLSADARAAADPVVRDAVAWVRRHAADPLDASDVVKAAGLSRATLDRRFRAALGTTPAREIRRAKLARALHLLGETRLTVAEVADRCGFAHAETFVRFVKRETGRPPSAHRAR